MNVWRPANNPELAFANSLSNYIGTLEARGSTKLPDLHKAECLFVFSDYGGEHRTANFLSYTFLIIDSTDLKPFSFFQTKLCQDFKLGSRIIEFKKLNDKFRLKALAPFLNLSNNLNGIIVSFLVHKSIKSLFYEKVVMEDDGMKPFRIWKEKTFEKILRVTNLIGLFVGGLSRPMQDLYWITDEDDIVVDDNKLTVLTEVFARITSQYVDFNLRHLRCGRTNIEKDTNFFEHLCSLTDLTSGAFSDLFTEYENSGTVTPSSKLIVPVPKNTKQKIITIGGWLADTNPKLKLRKLCLMLTKGKNNRIDISHINFHNLYNYAPTLTK